MILLNLLKLTRKMYLLIVCTVIWKKNVYILVNTNFAKNEFQYRITSIITIRFFEFTSYNIKPFYPIPNMWNDLYMQLIINHNWKNFSHYIACLIYLYHINMSFFIHEIVGAFWSSNRVDISVTWCAMISL